MSRKLRNIGMLLLLVLSGGARLSALTVSATAKLTITGAESSPYASGDIMVAFNGFVETVHYAQFSGPESLAAGLAAMFSRDYIRYGLYAKAGATVGGTTDPLNVITFQLTNGKTFGSINYTQPTTPFTLTPSGFASSGSTVADSGTISLFVNGSAIASAQYGDGSTPASITQSLASAASASTLVTVKADGSQLYITSQATGSAANYPYSLTMTHDAMDFTHPSFHITPISGALAGGADSVTPSAPVPVYCYSVTNSTGCDSTGTSSSGYDVAGNVVHMADSVMGAWAYAYDDLNRLISAQAANGPYVANQQPDICWSYDNFGNRTHQSLSNGTFANAPGSPCAASTGATFVDTSATYAATNNRMTSSTLPGLSTPITPSYDAGGDVLKSGINTYLYDAEGRICAVHGVSGMTGYQYDAQGDRVGKGTITSMSCDVTTNGYQPTSDYILDQSGAQMTELAVNQSGTSIWQHTNVKAEGILIATYNLTGLHFYLNDALGTRRAQTDQAGVLEQTCLSLPFGDQLNCAMSTSAPTENHFTGKERDAESGLDYFGARYFNSAFGRWMSPDWSVTEEALPYANLNEPQTLNLYTYVGNNPLNRTDPLGHWMAYDHMTITFLAYEQAHIQYNRSVATAIRDVDSGGHNVYIGALFGTQAFKNAQNSFSAQADHFLRDKSQSQMQAYNAGVARFESYATTAYKALQSGDTKAFHSAMGGAGHVIEDSFAHTDREYGNGAITHIQCYTCSGADNDHEHPILTDSTGSLSPQGRGAVDATANFLDLMKDSKGMSPSYFQDRLQQYEDNTFQQKLKDK